MYRLKLENNKYEIIEDLEHGIFKAERYGEEWRDLSGDNLMLALIYKVQELERQNETLKKNIQVKQFNIEDVYKEYECDFK